MSDIHFLLTIAYISAIELFGFIMLYPIIKDLLEETFEDAFLVEIIAFVITISALTYTALNYTDFAYHIITSIGISIVLISMFSGFSLAILSRIYRVNIVLFALSIMLSTVPYIIEGLAVLHGMRDLALTLNVINELIYLIGVGEGAVKYLLPAFKEFYIDSQAEALTALLITICILTVALQWAGLEAPYTLQYKYIENVSTIAFIAGGSMGYAVLWVSKQKPHVA